MFWDGIIHRFVVLSDKSMDYNKFILSNKKLRFLEFLIIGVLVGLFEDLLVVFFATDAEIDLGVIWIAFLVALPFAVFSELIVDHPRFWEILRKKPNKNQQKP